MACHEPNLIWPQSPMTTIRSRKANTDRQKRSESKRDNCQHE